ncbi:bifunctional folylpolyglutamate synthase/dihydrofolate synthase [Pelovirga terrestris]|uniref:Dihydrofolate synthase/folylpolyglutamate synthase n=1 Tax=Pelovirga terrestris TaxID=2771352 RepID=A0A8J6QM39_9BACT|nr:folylpolyglutamate synthase/dihydrofolate synthase family protein [Pelovirga terrestris]MBD1399787.1 bifunctional folylpolyglutamate synthase/dihydrofolate synthase [Pelovirga terrestris]
MLPDHRDSLDYLYALRFFGIKLGLETITELLDRVGNPQHHLRILHIAGTNGKGSTAAALAAVFHAAGISAGLYTSPHLHQFTERIRVDTRQLELDEIVALIKELRPHAEQLQATFFEVTTAMALLAFQRHGVSWAIMECGMGGRLDATNAVVPELCLITPVALDHTRHLGETLAQVAREKAGIVKSGVPVISACQDAEAAEVLAQRAQLLGSRLLLPGRDYSWQSRPQEFDVQVGSFELKAVRPILPGLHQHQNLALAAAAAGYLRDIGVELEPSAVRSGLERVCWPGRLEWLSPQLLLDGAHNQAGAAILADYLRQQHLARVHLIFGCKADKQVLPMLHLLLPFCQALYATRPPVEDAADTELLCGHAADHAVAAQAFAEPIAALAAARQSRAADELIVVAGSLFLVAAIREQLVVRTDVTPIMR